MLLIIQLYSFVSILVSKNSVLKILCLDLILLMFRNSGLSMGGEFGGRLYRRCHGILLGRFRLLGLAGGIAWRCFMGLVWILLFGSIGKIRSFGWNVVLLTAEALLHSIFELVSMNFWKNSWWKFKYPTETCLCMIESAPNWAISNY